MGLAALLWAAPAQAQSVIYVDADASGANTGQSWDDAFTDLQSALAVAEAGDEVWVAEGAYTPTDGSDRTISFVLTSGVALYGGFDGTEQSRDERDWTEHETILSGEIGDPDDEDDNSFHVVVASDPDPTTTLNGLTLTYGEADAEAPPHDRGGGLHVVGGALTIRHCTFRDNDAYLAGGGAAVSGGAPLFEDVLFEGGLANRGGGAYFTGSDPVLRRVTLRENSAGQLFFEDGSNGFVEDVLIEDGPAGGLVIIGSSPRFVRVTVRNNRVEHGPGGGVRIEDGAAPLFEDCLFEGNTAHHHDGGAVHLRFASALFLRTTFSGNRATFGSGGAIMARGAPVTCIGCRFERNRSDGSGGALATDAAVAIVNARFYGNEGTLPTAGGGALLLYGAPPPGETQLVANALFAGNEAAAGGAVFLASPQSARLVNVTLAGNRAREDGGAILAEGAEGVRIEHAVLWGNEAPVDPEISVYEDGHPVVTQSIVAGGYPTGTNILDADPLFVRSPDPGADGRWGTEDDDYGDLRLLEGSPAVDYGLAEYLPPDTWDLDGDGDTTEPLPVDLDGNPRQVGWAPDLGAYEGAVRVSNEPGVPPDEERGLRAWPNPASRVLHIQADAEEAVLYDVLGREVLRVRLDGVTEVEDPDGVGVDLSGLAPGVYVVRAGGQAAIVTVRR